MFNLFSLSFNSSEYYKQFLQNFHPLTPLPNLTKTSPSILGELIKHITQCIFKARTKKKVISVIYIKSHKASIASYMWLITAFGVSRLHDTPCLWFEGRCVSACKFWYDAEVVSTILISQWLAS